ncbi:ATP-binding protein [Aurantiacibacter xanthus]|uniref:ATP-binding protein n=1 Tax=Aurantiacibacter xanthus TaxID=1784712 RepID=A0A3A1P8W8_9SPHN|nr:AAA family ATPase [Aurantiacibacter xanthus]RIV88684.1 ATP-binding protein [Aurantiacibacter xanthus]
MEFDQISIVGVFDGADFTLPLQGPPKFLVGPNGSGKTTVIKAVFFAGTGQWDRLASLPINGVEFTGNGRGITVEKADFILFSRIDRLLQTTSRPRSSLNKRFWPETWEEAEKTIRKSRMAQRYPKSVMEQIESEYELLAIVNNFTQRETRDRILYFPTYRRVEKDLKDLVNVDTQEDVFELESGSNLSSQIENRYKQFGEVIGFGGQDIALLIDETAEDIRQKARVALNEHSIGFLEALVSADLSKTRHFRNYLVRADNANQLIDKIQRYAPSTMKVDAIKNEVSRLVQKLKGQPWGRLRQKEDMLLYYLSELHTLVEKVERESRPLLSMVEILNEYLGSTKTASMDAQNNVAIYDNNTKNPLQFEELSSGEKQIVAFFAFLILHENNDDLIVLLDEPELSLSVSWQKKLISDMLKTRRCLTIISATHSPFIIESYPLEHLIALGHE